MKETIDSFNIAMKTKDIIHLAHSCCNFSEELFLFRQDYSNYLVISQITLHQKLIHQ